MSIHKTVWLYCDGNSETCPLEDFAYGECEGKTAVDLRAEAKEDGWVNHGRFDFCPTCAPDHDEQKQP